jgi:group I intron endonuclease
MIKCKLDERLFYIGQAVKLSVRLLSHFSRSALDSNKLGTILSSIGWANFSVHVLEICSEGELRIREAHYIK